MSQILSEMLTWAHMFTGNWNLGWIQLETTSKIIIVGIEDAPHNLISKNEFPTGLATLLEDILILKSCPLEESASHHDRGRHRASGGPQSLR